MSEVEGLSHAGYPKQATTLLSIVNAVGETISWLNEPQQILDSALDKLLEVLPIDAGWVELFDEKSGQLTVAAGCGFSPEVRQEMASGQGLSEQVALSGEPLVIPDLSAGARHGPVSPSRTGLHSYAAVPLRSPGRIRGVLAVASRAKAQFTAEVVELLVTIASQISLALDRAKLYRETREKEEQLRVALAGQATEQLGSFHAISHELKTPLTSIIAAGELMSEEIKGEAPEAQQKLVQNIVHSARSLEARLDKLLDSGKVRGALRLEMRPLSVKRLLKQVVEHVKPIAERKRQSLVVDVPTSLPVITADAQQLEEVLRNLLMNAFKYTSEGGSIALMARKRGTNLVIGVQDNGIGIPKEEQDRVFEPYYRVASNGEPSLGLGLGLALSKQVVELHGGRIWVDSEPGKGSTFAFSLPIGQRGGWL